MAHSDEADAQITGNDADECDFTDIWIQFRAHVEGQPWPLEPNLVHPRDATVSRLFPVWMFWSESAPTLEVLLTELGLAARGASLDSGTKRLWNSQGLFVDFRHGDGHAQAAGEARRFVDRAHRVGLGSGASVLSAFE